MKIYLPDWLAIVVLAITFILAFMAEVYWPKGNKGWYLFGFAFVWLAFIYFVRFR